MYKYIYIYTSGFLCFHVAETIITHTPVITLDAWYGLCSIPSRGLFMALFEPHYSDTSGQ